MTTPSEFTAATAADPSTPPAVLADIATHRPDLRAAVAANPRSKTDEELRGVAEKGGYVGIYFMPFLAPGKPFGSAEVIQQFTLKAQDVLYRHVIKLACRSSPN